MSRILVLIPVRSSLHVRLKRRAAELAALLPAANPGCELEIVLDEAEAPPGEGRTGRMAALRNDLLLRHLADPHDHVMWVDADLWDYSAKLPSLLLARCNGGMDAPLVVLDTQPPRHYDTHGFVERGRPSRHDPPYFDQPGPVVDLDSVGTLVMAAADVYRRGARHAAAAGFTEWLSVGRFAREMGRPVRAHLDLPPAVHAYLPHFGEEWH